MRYLGIDYGSKRVGVALSDPSGSFATPLDVLRNDQNLLEEIKRICSHNHVESVVVGDSKDFNLRDNFIMGEVRPFVEKLKSETNLQVILHPEFMTSQEAERIQGKNDRLDASAAALILKSYLDSNK